MILQCLMTKWIMKWDISYSICSVYIHTIYQRQNQDKTILQSRIESGHNMVLLVQTSDLIFVWAIIKKLKSFYPWHNVLKFNVYKMVRAMSSLIAVETFPWSAQYLAQCKVNKVTGGFSHPDSQNAACRKKADTKHGIKENHKKQYFDHKCK